MAVLGFPHRLCASCSLCSITILRREELDRKTERKGKDSESTNVAMFPAAFLLLFGFALGADFRDVRCGEAVEYCKDRAK